MSAEVREGYKQTEVGVIPDDWEVKNLGDIGDTLIGLTYHPSDVDSDGILVLRSSNIQNGMLDFNNNVYVKSKVPENIMVNYGDILICVRNGSRELIGKSTILDDRANGMTFGAFMSVFRSQYFYFLSNFFKSDIFFRQVQEHLGATINQITNKSLNSFLVALPPPPEQRAIASALADVDALLASLDDLLTKKRQLKQAAMQELLTGKTRLDGFTGEWESTALKDLAERFIVPMRDKPIFGGDIPWCRIEDFSGKYLTRSKSRQKVSKETIEKMNLKIMPVDTLLISCSADLGRCAIVGAPLITNQTFIGLVPNKSKSNVEFLYYLVGSRAEELNNLSSGTTISYLSREHFENFAVFLPLDVAEQKAIASILSEMDAELDALAERVTKTRQLKQGMMQELLTGRTRLI